VSEHDPLLDEFRDLFAHDDPVPPLVTETAKAALGWRRLDADLAELLSDSSLGTGEPALARGAGATLRSVSFSAGSLTIDIEIHGENTERTLLGQLSPAPPQARIEVQPADDGAPAVVMDPDELGRFRAQLPPGNAFRLRVALGEGPRPKWIETSWIPM
jgi:hypothetical protein